MGNNITYPIGRGDVSFAPMGLQPDEVPAILQHGEYVIGRGNMYFAKIYYRTGPWTTRNVRRRAKRRKAHTRHVQYREIVTEPKSWIGGVPNLAIDGGVNRG